MFDVKFMLTLSILFLFGLSSNSQTYNIDDYDGQTVSTCSGTFYDSGGSGAYYSDNEDYTVAFCSDNGVSLSMNFTSFEVRAGDTLWIYDGPDTSSSLLGAYSGEGMSFSVSSSGTCLTFNFKSDPNFTRAGWEADILV